MDQSRKGTPEHEERVAKYLENHKKGQSRRKIRSANKKLKRNLQPKGPRRRGWELDDPDQWDELDYEQNERVMPRDERDRRREVENMAFQEPPAQDGLLEQMDTKTALGVQGMVVSVSSGLSQVEIGDALIPCRVRGRLSAQQTGFTNIVAVGDEVIISQSDDQNGIIEQVLPRRTTLTRPDVFRSHLRQVMVANAHQLLIVSAWRDPIIWLELIDRYLIAAQRSGLEPVICVNKADLIEDEAEFTEKLQPYHDLGYKVIRTSAETLEGVDELSELLKGRMTVLTGLSGTGKSSLISAIQPDLDLRAGEVSEHSGEGRHTTTQATMHKLDIGGTVIDTPGIREFGLSGLRKHELADFFPEIAEEVPGCRFNDCTHIAEPDCAVQEAARSGAIPASRYHSYKLIQDTLPD